MIDVIQEKWGEKGNQTEESRIDLFCGNAREEERDEKEKLYYSICKNFIQFSAV